MVSRKLFILSWIPLSLGIFDKVFFRKTRVILEPTSCLSGQYYDFVSETTTSSSLKCGINCKQNPDCRRFMFDRKTKICSMFEAGENCLTDTNIDFKICYRLLTLCSEVNCTRCPIGYYGDRCQYIIKDCFDGLAEFASYESIMSFIRPSSTGPVIEVKCDFDHIGFTTIQDRSRLCTEVAFNRTWKDYVNGFGNRYSEYWIGLTHIYNMLQNYPKNRLLVKFVTNAGSWKIVYIAFNISDESNKFSFSAGSVAPNTQTAGDSILNGSYSIQDRPFSTYDNDKTSFNCTQRFKSGWWFLNDTACSKANPNGILNGDEFESSTHWFYNLGSKTDFVRITMSIKGYP